MVVSQGDVVWASLPAPAGSEAGYRRPVVVVQGDSFNASRLRTAVVVPLTSNVRWAGAPGSALLEAAKTGLPRDSVANAFDVLAIDRSFLDERVGHLRETDLQLVLSAIDLVLGRE